MLPLSVCGEAGLSAAGAAACAAASVGTAHVAMAIETVTSVLRMESSLNGWTTGLVSTSCARQMGLRIRGLQRDGGAPLGRCTRKGRGALQTPVTSATEVVSPA